MRAVRSAGRTSFAAALLALAVALVAWVEPVENVQSDPALTLLAAQALVEHGTLTLDPYRDDPRCAYDLEHDYRVRAYGGSLYYFAPGAQLLAAPFVLAASGLGLDMLRPGDEAATQNAVSGLLLALDTWLLFALLRRLASARAALVITAVTLMGSPLVSTLATALWGAAFAVPLLLEALRLVVRHATDASPRLPLARLAVLCGLAFLCRPAAACFVPALLAYVVVARGFTRRRVLLLAAGALALGVPAWLFVAPHVPAYYSLAKLRPQTPLALGLYGMLFSPSRGLFVFCPFLLPLAFSLVRARGASEPRERALFALGFTWFGVQVLLTSLKGNWWGGYSFGPRLLTEALPATALLAALAWRRLERAQARRGLLAGAYVLLGLVAIGIHVRQGLFNRATQAWNRAPDPGAEGELVLWWRYPQFLATDASLREREIVFQERRLLPLHPGERVAPLSRQAVFVDFHPYEIAWRPSRALSTIRLRPLGFDAAARYVLELRARVASARDVRLALDGQPLGSAAFTPSEPHARRFVVAGAWLQRPQVEISLDVPQAARVSLLDPRVVGVDFHGLRLAPLATLTGELRFDQDAYFAQGFGDVEHGARWTRDSAAELLLPLPEGWRGKRCRLELEAGANGRQVLELGLDGGPLARFTLEGREPARVTAEFAAARLRPGQVQRLGLQLPQARSLPNDPRRLGLRFVRLSLGCS